MPTDGPARARLLPAADHATLTWKNGGGTTREIAHFPSGAGMDDFIWRISLAEVRKDGPFSEFGQVDRILTMVDGAGMELTVDGHKRLIDTRYVPHALSGDAPTACRLLDGKVVNLNVMWRRGQAQVSVAIVRGCRALSVAVGAQSLVVALDAPTTVAGLSLSRYDAALLSCGEAELDTAGAAAVFTLAGA
ncbi:HutD family protein [Streptomyces sp. 205]|uniref:HutD family protein n=2 Tax=Streptomyces coffeae TaxID=621382 RepID=A0ABS1NRN3_9ACTN|nr:HutD family protein [Streptomyces coffeae]